MTRSGKRASRSSWKSSAAAEYPPTVIVMPLVPRSCAWASCRARITTSVAVVSDVVSARITSMQREPPVAAQVRVEEIGVLGPRRGQVAVEHRVAQQASLGLHIHHAPHLAHPRVGLERVGQRHEPPERGRLDRAPSFRQLHQHPHRLDEPGDAHRRERLQALAGFGARRPPVARRQSDLDEEHREREQRDDRAAVPSARIGWRLSVRAHFSHTCGAWYQVRRSASQRGRSISRPSTASRAGRSVIESSTATATTMSPPMPTLRVSISGVSSSAPKPTTTVSPEVITARPAVARVLAAAIAPPRRREPAPREIGSPPAASSRSRHRARSSWSC